MKRIIVICLIVFGVGSLYAQAPQAGTAKTWNYRNAKPKETDSKGRVLETIDDDRMLDFSESGITMSAAEYRAHIQETGRLKKVKKDCGEWFEAIQLLEADEVATDKVFDATKIVSELENIPKSGTGILAYIEAMRIFKTGANVEASSETKRSEQLKAALEEMLRRKGGEVICGQGHGVSIAYPMELLLVRYQSWKNQHTEPEDVKPAKSADYWPGKVPADAQRVTKKIKFYPFGGGWRSTGLYAPPGELITITCGSLQGNLTAQIGCHTDALDPQIFALDDNGKPDKDLPINLMKVKMGWQQVTDNRALFRWPEMVRRFSITRKKAEIANALGGPLYFTWSGGKRPMDIEISGCVQMPYFRLGLDTDEDWRNTIRHYPAPWAEIETKNLIITVQSGNVRHIDHMTALAQWWGKAVAIQYRLAGRALASDSEAKNFRPDATNYSITNKGKLVSDGPADEEILYRRLQERAKKGEDVSGYDTIAEKKIVRRMATKPLNYETEGHGAKERIVDDIQISIGAGHSGYPIMCIFWGGGMMNLKGIQRSGSWGAMHEVGHNMGQGRNGIYALPGNVEVICNIFGCAVMNLVNGTPLRSIYPSMWNSVKAGMDKKPKSYWSKANVSERMVFYLTIAEAFGWPTWMKAVNDDGKYPSGELGDRMCCTLSSITKRDLTPYFEMWGLPISKNAYTYTSKWPPWPTEAEAENLYGVDEYSIDPSLRMMDISSPEEVKTRRQLRTAPKIPYNPYKTSAATLPEDKR